MTKITLPATDTYSFAARLVSILSKANRTNTPTGKVYYGVYHNVTLTALRLDAGGYTVTLLFAAVGTSGTLAMVSTKEGFAPTGEGYALDVAQEVLNLLTA
jgi:hypothetical protein